MGSNLTVNKEIEEYINNNSIKLHPVQKEIITHNEELGDIKRMQISISQCHFLHLLIKSSKIKKILEIGTFTGLSTLSMSLALPEDGSVIALDKNQETSKTAVNFFKKAAVYPYKPKCLRGSTPLSEKSSSPLESLHPGIGKREK